MQEAWGECAGRERTERKGKDKCVWKHYLWFVSMFYQVYLVSRFFFFLAIPLLLLILNFCLQFLILFCVRIAPTGTRPSHIQGDGLNSLNDGPRRVSPKTRRGDTRRRQKHTHIQNWWCTYIRSYFR